MSSNLKDNAVKLILASKSYVSTSLNMSICTVRKYIIFQKFYLRDKMFSTFSLNLIFTSPLFHRLRVFKAVTTLSD